MMSRPHVLLVFVLIALGCVGLQFQHYAGRDYRQDEAWIVHGTLHRSPQEIVVWVAGNIHMPLWTVMADIWVGAVGHQEVPARYLSTLFTLISLALVYRLGTVLYTPEAGLAAAALLGLGSFFLFYSYEFRPYPALITLTLAAQVSFLHWLRLPNFGRALLFVACGIAALYSHFFALYVFAAMALFALFFVRRRLMLKTVGLFVAIGLSFLGWLLPFLHAILVVNPEGVNYAYDSTWETIITLSNQIAQQPVALVALLLLVGVLLSARAVLSNQPTFANLRFNPNWRKWYPVIITVGIFGLAFAVNLWISTLTRRNIVVMLPTIAVFAGFAVVHLPRRAVLAVLILFVVGALSAVEYEGSGPYGEMIRSMASDYQAGSPVVLNIEYLPWQIPALYFLEERLPVHIPGEDVLQVLDPRQDYLNFMPVEPVNAVYDPGHPSMEQLTQFVGDAPTVWYIARIDDRRFNAVFEPWILRHYTAIGETEWGEDYQHFRIVEYRRNDSALSALPLGM
jgi:hypothetical protein